MVPILKLAIIGGVVMIAIAGITVGIVLGTNSDDVYDITCDKLLELQFAEVDGKLLASWSKSGNTKDCIVKYKFKYTIDGGTEVSMNTRETQYLFEDLKLDPCTEVNVLVIAINKNDEESDQATATYTKDVHDGFGMVTELTVTLTHVNNVLAEWTGPSGFKKCHVLYRVTFGHHSIDVDILNHTAAVYVCATTTISVTPIIGDVTGEVKSKDIYLEIFEGFSSISSWGIEKHGEKLKITWNESSAFQWCSITYKVGFDNSAETEVDSFEVEYDLSKGVCYYYDVTITPYADEVMGRPVNERKYIDVDADFGAVSDLVITHLNVNLEDRVLVQWVRPEGFENCYMDYLVVRNGIMIVVDEPFMNYPIDFCMPTNYNVTPRVGNILGESRWQDFTLYVPEEFAKVDSLEMRKYGNRLLATWEEPADYKTCKYRYNVVLNDVLVFENINETTVYYDLIDVCSEYNIMVTPVIDGVEGIPDTVNITTGVEDKFGVVTNFTITPIEDNEVLATWYGPLGLDGCDLKYRLTIDGKVVVVAEEEAMFSMDYCKTTVIAIVPVVDDVFGIDREYWKVLQIPDNFTGLDFLALTKNKDNLRVSWWKLEVISKCNVTYQVMVNGVKKENVITTEVEYELSDGVCVEYTVEVTPVVDEIFGETDIKSKIIDPDYINEVESLQTGIEEGKFVASWTKPSGVNKCTLEYNIELKFGGNIIIATSLTEQTHWEYLIQDACSEGLEFTIFAKYGTVSGQSLSKSVTC